MPVIVYEILKHDMFSARLTPLIVMALRLYPFIFTHLVAQIVGEDPSRFIPYLLCQGVIAVGGVFPVFLLYQFSQISSVPFVVIDVSAQPFIVSGSVDRHDLTEISDRIFFAQFFDDLVFAPEIETYSLFKPPPFTRYPFFSRSFSIFSFRFSSSSFSSLVNDLDVCRAA